MPDVLNKDTNKKWKLKKKVAGTTETLDKVPQQKKGEDCRVIGKLLA